RQWRPRRTCAGWCQRTRRRANPAVAGGGAAPCDDGSIDCRAHGRRSIRRGSKAQLARYGDRAHVIEIRLGAILWHSRSDMSYKRPLETRRDKKVTRGITEYGLIEDGDRVMVGLSGGKDSWALLNILDVLRKRAPIQFSLVAVCVDSGYEGYRHD